MSYELPQDLADDFKEIVERDGVSTLCAAGLSNNLITKLSCRIMRKPPPASFIVYFRQENMETLLKIVFVGFCGKEKRKRVFLQ